MRRPETVKEVYEKCQYEGLLKFQEGIDTKKIRFMIDIAKKELGFAETILKKTSEEDREWSIIYKIYYDIIRELIDAFLRFDKIKSSNHLCLFAFLCYKHSELELDWNFFEKIRTKRNGILYYGVQIKYDDWKEIELQVNLYIKILTKAIEEKLRSS